MGTITFEGDRPFELVTQRLPTAMSEGETVVLTLPVFVGGFPRQVADIQVRLMVEHAEQLAAQIQPTIQQAWAQKSW
jgi:hypothetical protein